MFLYMWTLIKWKSGHDCDVSLLVNTGSNEIRTWLWCLSTCEHWSNEIRTWLWCFSDCDVYLWTLIKWNQDMTVMFDVSLHVNTDQMKSGHECHGSLCFFRDGPLLVFRMSDDILANGKVLPQLTTGCLVTSLAESFPNWLLDVQRHPWQSPSLTDYWMSGDILGKVLPQLTTGCPVTSFTKSFPNWLLDVPPTDYWIFDDILGNILPQLTTGCLDDNLGNVLPQLTIRCLMTPLAKSFPICVCVCACMCVFAFGSFLSKYTYV